MANALNIIGLLMNLLGMILLFVFGRPFRVRNFWIGLFEGHDQAAARSERWRDVLGWLGLASIVLGTAATAWRI